MAIVVGAIVGIAPDKVGAVVGTTEGIRVGVGEGAAEGVKVGAIVDSL
jgi:hypothetical protein